ncbi:MAG: T9SS type A sorting domain-containing protein, partial [Bacteroidia bacterium]|nr:T9SS type A sorting domain-containing protein [Bacteroidia bacterium]
ILTFAPGEMSKTVSVAILADSVLEDDRWFAIELSDPVGADLGTLNLFPIVIVDGQRPFVDFARLDTMIAENVGTALIPIRLSFPVREPISIALETRRGTAIPLEDYRPVNITFSIAPGSYQNIAFPITILDDDHLEGTVRYFTLRIAEVSPNARLGDNDTIQIRIADDDFRPNLQFVGTTDTVLREATNIHGQTGNIVRAKVALSFPNPYPVSFTYSTLDGTALAGEDFERRNRARVVLPPGSTNVEIELPVYNDLTPEPVEEFSLVIDCLSAEDCSISPNAQAGANLRFNVVLLDNEPSRRFAHRSFPLRLYPNPTTGTTRVYLPSDAGLPKFTLSDPTGKTYAVPASSVAEGAYELNLERLPSGFYTLDVESGGRRAAVRVVKTY